MKMSTKGRYGLYSCIQLAQNYNNRLVSITEVAHAIGVGEKYLEQIFSLLKKGNIIIANRGKGGGYSLVNLPRQTSVGSILRAVEDNLRIADCIDSNCASASKCPTRNLFSTLYNSINSFLDNITLEQLATPDKRVYLDNSATTPLDADVLSAMTPYFGAIFGNANSLHDYGRQANKAVAHAREQVAHALNAKSSEIYFTSCGTEANNWVLKGVLQAKKDNGNHIIISQIEHPSVLNTAKYLEKQGYRVTYLGVDKYGKVNPSDLEQAICPDTVLVSIMYANNEVGTIQPIKQLAEVAHKHSVLFHSDCVQAVGSIAVDVRELDVDFATISAHKFYGPKGIGALYIKTGVKIDKLIIGGEQERNQRGGTTNTPSVVGMGASIEKANNHLNENSNKISAIRNHFIDRVLAEIPYATLNGHPTDRLPGNANFSFEFIEGEGILMLLDFGKIAVSSGSACSSQSLLPSHVLLAMGVDIVLAHGSIRFSFGKYNTLAEADYTVDVLKDSIAKLRQMSPLFILKEGVKKDV